MMRILIPYGTTEGLTARISEYVADVIRARGHEADAVDIKGSGERPGAFP
jgi:menaquinone-dependent protoporphyrinogen oxidase